MASTVRCATPEELATVPTPAGNDRWLPQAHQAAHSFIVTALRDIERRVEEHRLYLYRSEQRLIGLLHVDTEVCEGHQLVLAFTNAIDMSLSQNCFLGTYARDTETFSFGIDLAGRKATTNAVGRFHRELRAALAGLSEHAGVLAAGITTLHEHPVSDERAHSILLRAYDRRLLSSRTLLPALRLWETPPHACLVPRTAYSLLQTIHCARRSYWGTDPRRNLYSSMQVEQLVRGSMG